MNFLIDVIPFLLIAAVVYFLIVKPQVDERRQHEALVNSLARDDRVVTSAGIHGKVVEVGEKTVVLELGEKSRVTFDKNAVVRREGDAPKGRGGQEVGLGR